MPAGAASWPRERRPDLSTLSRERNPNLMKKHAFVTGTRPSYRLRLSAEGMASDYWPLAGVQFARYRAAQNVANAAHRLIAEAVTA